jgi:hypothetical protein
MPPVLFQISSRGALWIKPCTLDLRATVRCDQLYLSLQEPVGAPSIMNQESMPLRVRAFRVIDYKEEEYCRFIVI